MSRLSALLATLLLCYFVTPTYAANLIEVSDTLSNPKTSTTTKHTLSFTTDSAVSNGFFRLLISDSFTLNSPASITAANTTGYTFVSGVATSSGDPNCISPTNYHCLEIHYSGSGAVGAPITITINSGTLTNPSSEGAFSFLLRHYDNLGTLISQTTGRLSIHDNPVVSTTVLPIEISLSPQLLFPDANAVTNNPFEPLGFKRAYSITGVSHYNLYIDDVLSAGNINHSPISQDSYFFSSNRVGETIQVNLKYPMSEGRHKWQVTAVSLALPSITANSESRYFYVDSSVPLIVLTNVGNNSMSWASYDPSTIPPAPRELIVNSKDPLLKGKVEAYSNLKISLLCPNVQSAIYNAQCIDQSITVNETDGNWEHLFHNLVKDVKYTGYLAAVDAAGNTNIFPEFFVTYQPFSFISYIFPTATPTVTPSPISTPTPSSPVIITPTPSIKTPPPQPSIPPQRLLTPATPQPQILDTRYLILLTLIGLLLHLGLTSFGAGIAISQFPSFLWHLLLPFFVPHDYQTISNSTLSFVSLSLYNADNIKDKSFQTVSQIKGFFSLPAHLKKHIFIKVHRPGFIFQDRILDSRTLSSIKRIKLEAKKRLTALERLQVSSLGVRWLPLLIADLTGLLYLSVTVSPSALTYTLIAIQLTYSEYIYPRK